MVLSTLENNKIPSGDVDGEILFRIAIDFVLAIKHGKEKAREEAYKEAYNRFKHRFGKSDDSTKWNLIRKNLRVIGDYWFEHSPEIHRAVAAHKEAAERVKSQIILQDKLGTEIIYESI